VVEIRVAHSSYGSSWIKLVQPPPRSGEAFSSLGISVLAAVKQGSTKN
jgi:hypothetical protein